VAIMNSLTDLIRAGLGAENGGAPPALPRRRKRLWELPTRWHCPLIGTCLTVGELRKLAARAGLDVADMSDYTLHVTVVSSCDGRSRIAEILQRHFEKQYAPAVKRFACARDAEQVLALWKGALAEGNDIPGALWAAFSHAEIDHETGQEIYGDIHMLSHQQGAAVRANLRRLDELKRENHRLRNDAAAYKMGLAVVEREKDKAVAELERRLAVAEQKAMLLGQREIELAEARRQARDYEHLLARAEAMARRIETLEERNAANARRAGELERKLSAVSQALAETEKALELALGIGECKGVAGTDGCGRSCPAETALAGRCVLCVGGRTSLVEAYRRLVEMQGGRFLHHDGGEEQSLRRVDSAVASADAVVCQSGCVSHAAYYRLKEACKKLGKPCVFVQSPGIASFAQGLSALAGGTQSGAGHGIRLIG